MAQQPESKLPQRVDINGIEFTLIPAGPFTYTVETGASLREVAPDHIHYRHVSVWLDPFYIALYETRAEVLVDFLNSDKASQAVKEQYRKDWMDSKRKEESDTSGCTLKIDDSGVFAVRGAADLPATDLSWDLANQFAQALGFRLPTEAEWQKAARGTDKRLWPWGDTLGDDTYANFGMGRPCQPVSVGSFARDRSPYGVYQMAGNVSEHVADWYNEEFDAALTDGVRNPKPAATGSPFPYTPPKRITKGGDWSPGITFLAIGFRNYTLPDNPSSRYGVRFAIDAQRVENLLDQHKAHALTP
jgi:iron(II)-dependent oxidoreductase